MSNQNQPRAPKYGDEVFVPSHHPDGHWCNGIVNSGAAGAHDGGKLLVAAPGHAKANLVSVSIDAYGKQWCYPEDVGATQSGQPKRASLDDLQG